LTCARLEAYSIAELLDDPIAKLLMKSDGVNCCDLRLQLAITARLHATARASGPG
jgi:hypothetical protein